MRCISAFITFGLVLVLSATTASAQNLTVQQPVFRNFSVGTTVSVPDRGGAYLGGVSRAGSSRRSFGPLRSGSSFGLFRENSAASAHVTIHDMRAMDEFLLGQAERGSVGRYRTTRSGPAANAYSSLTNRRGTRNASARVGRTSAASSSPVTRADRSFRLGQQAEAKGKTSLARLHYKMAAKHGSSDARERLTSLDGRSTVATTGGLK
ncbi:MAG: hypothetical protein HON53_16040 [Planctomycetaceae bacterium]|jgi:hypothetical protein|nr:hypothetical protein [Planctomycetaceae bacterium]MBT6153561.1 hypothetical protein [Planctomycetaceae bacterium]MBT6483058.1 hypothetical protein [Planctomycetaceae bacterium]MBT6495393.1 hypothetical protein [Planctomycetaceae bacterium]